jgi:MoaA/NifB/PqqE/SkfB family radical SAM enzyme
MEKYSRVYIEITNICNKSCSFCHGTKRERKMLSEEEFSHIAKSLVGVTDYLYFHIMGEPTAHPLLCRFVEIANSLGFKVAITTNGTLLNRVGDALISSGVYKVNISLHSLEGEDNAEYLKSVIDFADRASQSGVLTVLRLWNGGEENPENDGVIKYLKQRLTGEWRFGARGARIRHRLHLEYGERFEWPDANLPKITERVFCYGLSDHFGILSNGTVIPCCLDSEGIIALGNIFEKPISEILSSERAEKMRCGFKERIGVEPLCQRCGYATRFSKN